MQYPLLPFWRSLATMGLFIALGTLQAFAQTTTETWNAEVLIEEYPPVQTEKKVFLHRPGRDAELQVGDRTSDAQRELFESLVTGDQVAVQRKQSHVQSLPVGGIEHIELDSTIAITTTTPMASAPVAAAPDEVAAVTRRSIATFIVTFNGQTPVSRSSVEAALFRNTNSLNAIVRRSSYGSEEFVEDNNGDGQVDIFGPYDIGTFSSDPCTAYSTISEQVEALAALDGIDVTRWQHRAFYLPASITCSWAGVANLGCSSSGCRSWYDSSHVGWSTLLPHEIGHNQGMHHAGTDSNDDGTIDSEYADHSSYMGNPSNSPELDGAHRHFKSWLPLSNVIDGTGGGEFRISALDISPTSASYPQAIRIFVNSLTYVLSYRRPQSDTFDSALLSQYRNVLSIHRLTGSRTLLVGVSGAGTSRTLASGNTVEVLEVAPDFIRVQINSGGAPTATFTPTPAVTPTVATSPTPTRTPVQSPVPTSTNTAIPSPTITPTSTSSSTPTSLPSSTPTRLPTSSPLPTAPPTWTPTPQVSNTPVATSTATGTPTPRPSNTPSPTSSPTWTPTVRPSDTPSATNTPTSTPTPQPSNTPSVTPSATASHTATPQPTATSTNTPSVTPIDSPTNTPQPTASATPTPTRTAVPTVPNSSTLTVRVLTEIGIPAGKVKVTISQLGSKTTNGSGLVSFTVPSSLFGTTLAGQASSRRLGSASFSVRGGDAFVEVFLSKSGTRDAGTCSFSALSSDTSELSASLVSLYQTGKDLSEVIRTSDNASSAKAARAVAALRIRLARVESLWVDGQKALADGLSSLQAACLADQSRCEAQPLTRSAARLNRIAGTMASVITNAARQANDQGLVGEEREQRILSRVDSSLEALRSAVKAVIAEESSCGD